MKWFTSDLHLNHKNICRGVSDWDDENSTRDFNTLAEMNDAIIFSINDSVGYNDELYILGDFAFGDKNLIPTWRKQIKCNNIKLIYGNHDGAIQRNREFRNCFTWCGHYDEIYLTDKIGKKHFTCLFHYYIGGVWNKAQKGAFLCYGHSHGNMVGKTIGRAIDVGWDIWKRPLSENELCEKFVIIPIHKPIDHHTNRTNFS